MACLFEQDGSWQSVDPKVTVLLHIAMNQLEMMATSLPVASFKESDDHRQIVRSNKLSWIRV